MIFIENNSFPKVLQWFSMKIQIFHWFAQNITSSRRPIPAGKGSGRTYGTAAREVASTTDGNERSQVAASQKNDAAGSSDDG